MASKKAKSLGRIASALAAIVLIASGCSSDEKKSSDNNAQGVSDVTAQAITVDTTPPVQSGLEVTQVVTLDYEPEQDGFGFQNYGGGNAPAALTVNLARRLYGDEQACVSVNDLGECTPQPVILQLIEQANRAMAGGLCEGFAVLSLRLYQEGATTSLLGQEALVAALEQGDPRVAAELAFWFVTQFSSETQAAAAFYREQSPSEIVATLADDFANPLTTAGYTLGLYSAEGGHAVTPYAVEAVDNGSRIYIYDSNWPNETRWIDVVDNVWTYALAATNPTEAASAWTGSTGTLELTPMASRQPPFSCAFCPQPDGGKSMTLLTAAGSSDSQIALQVVDDQGRRLGVFDNELINEIPGAVYRYIATSNTADPVLILLPAEIENYTADVETLDDSDDGAVSLFVAQDGAGARVETTIADVTDESDDEPVLAVTEAAGYEVNDLEEASVDIADENVAVSIVIENNQELAFQFVAPEPPQPALPDTDTDVDADIPAQPEPPTAPQIMLSIATDEGEQIAEIEITQEEAEAPEEIVIEIDEEGEVELVVEEIEARPATIVAELRELVEERLTADPEEQNDWFVAPDENEEEPFILDLEDDFWDEELWEDDWHEEDDEWVWVESDDFVEWVEEEDDLGFIADLISDEFIAELEEIIERTEDLIEELPDRVDGEWSDDGWEVEIIIVETDDGEEIELIVIEDPLPPIEEWPEDPEDDTHDFSVDPLPDITMPDWLIPDDEGDIWWDDDDVWGGDDDVDDGIWLDIPDITLPEWNTDDDDDWPDDALDPDDLPDETLDDETNDGTDDDDTDDEGQDDDGQLDTDTQVGESPEPPEPPIEMGPDDDLSGGEPGEDTPEVPVIEDPPPPPPQPSWSGGSDSYLETLPNQTSTATDTATTTNVTSTLGFNSNDGYWYQQVTTATTVTETETVSTISSTRMRTYSWSCYDDGMGGGGCDDATSYGDTQSTTSVADPTVLSSTTTEVVTSIPANCSQGGWTGFGDWCIVGNWNTGYPNNRSEREIVQFTVPDDPDVVGERRRIVIEAESNLRYNQFNQNNQHGDPYIYLYEDDDPDVGDHTGDADEYTRGTFIELDDDGGRDCSVGGDSWTCNNPPADAEDEAEFPNDTIVGYSEPRPVIQNVTNAWDSEIDRLMEPGDYAVEGSVFNATNSGWYRLTISDETVESDGS
ncbi:MAG: hypothetical protein ACR2NF_06415 [Pirellulales bacterium]